MSVKMRVNNETDSKCDCCKAEWENTGVMYDIKFGSKTVTICRKCSDVLFQKNLRAACMYNAKVKTKQDQARISREMLYTGIKSEGGLTVSEALRGIKVEG